RQESLVVHVPLLNISAKDCGRSHVVLPVRGVNIHTKRLVEERTFVLSSRVPIIDGHVVEHMSSAVSKVYIVALPIHPTHAIFVQFASETRVVYFHCVDTVIAFWGLIQ